MTRIFAYCPILCLALMVMGLGTGIGKSLQTNEFYEQIDNYDQYTPSAIAVLPMDNLSLDTNLEATLYKNVYERLQSKGYRKVATSKVLKVMADLGIQTPGQLQGINLKRLSTLLNADALLYGQIDQSANIDKTVYNALVVSISLKLVHCHTGKTLWRCEQWRTAHRQWAIDPINILFNSMEHTTASREDRIKWLVQEVMKSLPFGNIKVEIGNLLDQAKQIQANQTLMP